MRPLAISALHLEGRTFRQGTVTFTDWLDALPTFPIRTASRLGDFLAESGHQQQRPRRVACGW
jgi:hypothetical protein